MQQLLLEVKDTLWEVLNPLLSDFTSYPVGFVLLQKTSPQLLTATVSGFPLIINSVFFSILGFFSLPSNWCWVAGGKPSA